MRHAASRITSALSLVGVLVTLPPLGGCDALGELDNFEIAVKSSATIPGAAEAEQVLAEFPEIGGLDGLDLTRSATFQNGGVDASKVKTVEISTLVLTALEPAGQDLAFLGTVVFHIGSPGQPRVEIARRTGFPAGAASVELEANGRNLKAYLVASEATITATLLDSTHPDSEVLVQVETVFFIDAGFL
ncbi:MAG: hypothetical protein ACI9MR_003249 [Myxococcota bacterium]|jgi:hypothetical protein